MLEPILLFENAGLEYLQIVDRLRPVIIHTFLARFHVAAAAGLRSTAFPAQLASCPSLPYWFFGSPRRHFRLTCWLIGAGMSMRNGCRMSENVADEISRLPTLSRADLLSLWRELFRQPAHPKLRRDLIVPILAYKLQEKAYGGLKPSTRRRLREIAEELERDRHAHVRSKPSIKPGTKLIRQWQDQTHEVLVTREGFEYRGRQYRSLSEIARQITGTRWSGPAFFGLKQLQNKRPNS